MLLPLSRSAVLPEPVFKRGKYVAEVGGYRNNIALPRDVKTIAHWYSEAGYNLMEMASSFDPHSVINFDPGGKKLWSNSGHKFNLLR